jgi:2-amino-4-hydroxy-6-hydroxymethyldihydropteridine diphosphokinase
MPKYLIALGSSHYRGCHYIEHVQQKIRNNKQILLAGKSRVFKNCSDNTIYNSLFYNNVLAVFAPLNPQVFYHELASIEHSLGRIRSQPNARRTIDIDVLMSFNFTYKLNNFLLPHPQALTRIFFVLPAIEALRSARWPIPHSIKKASLQFGKSYLCPLPEIKT